MPKSEHLSDFELYVMLAVPGALVALALAYLAALGTAERDRRDLALLRARGASQRSVLFLAAVESAALGLLAGTIGTGVALLAIWMVGSGRAIDTTRVLVAFAVCVALGFAGAAAARIAASVSVFRESVSEGRRSSRRQGRPLWERLYLDLTV